MTVTDAADATPEGVGDPILDLLNGFIVQLRAAGLPVSLTENLDAMQAIRHVPLEDRETFKYALAATLVKHHNHWKAFETVFEVYFSLRGDEYQIGDELVELPEMDDDEQGDQQGSGDQQGGGGENLTPEELAEMLYQSLMRGDQQMMRGVARQAVKRYAGMEPGRPVGGTYYLYRTLRNLDIDGVLERLLEQEQNEDGEAPSDFEQRLARDEYQSRANQLQQEIEAEIRRRLVADRGVEAMAKTLRKPLPEDVDFMHASREEMASLRKAIWPLTRKLAARLQRKRRHGRKGPLDFRRTVRASLSYGGPPSRSSETLGPTSRRSSSSPTFPARSPRSLASPFTLCTPSQDSSRRFELLSSSTALTRSPTCSKALRTSTRRCIGSTPKLMSFGSMGTPITATRWASSGRNTATRSGPAPRS